MRLAIPPILQTVLSIALVFGIDRVGSSASYPSGVLAVLALIAIIVGSALLVLAVGLFRKSETTVDPRYPEKSSAVVTSGIYAITRNPMYLGMALLVAAPILWLGSLAGLIVLPLFIAYMTQYQIKPEEEHLKQTFGASYVEYQRQVRRWI